MAGDSLAATQVSLTPRVVTCDYKNFTTVKNGMLQFVIELAFWVTVEIAAFESAMNAMDNVNMTSRDLLALLQQVLFHPKN